MKDETEIRNMLSIAETRYCKTENAIRLADIEENKYWKTVIKTLTWVLGEYDDAQQHSD